MSTAITEAITTLAEAEKRFLLHRVENEQFFEEWHRDLPELTEAEKTGLNDLRRRYLYQRSEGHLLEGTVTLLLASPLLMIAGFYDPPFKIKAEQSIQIILKDGEEVLQGRLDILVLHHQLWVVVLESKKSTLSVWSALPQTLAYLMGNPHQERPSYAMMTNGDEILFVKLMQKDSPEYDISRIFALFTSNQELYQVLQILKKLGNLP